MKKIFFFATLFVECTLNAQFSNEKRFIEFCKLSLEQQKQSLKVNGWELLKASYGGNPNADFKVSQALSYRRKTQSGFYILSIRLGSFKTGKMKETKLSLPNEQGLILNDWIGELNGSGFRFSQIDPYRLTAMGKNYTLLIVMVPSDGYSSPKSEISYMTH